MLTIAPVIDKNTVAACVNKVIQLNHRGGKYKYGIDINSSEGCDYAMVSRFTNGKCDSFVIYHINDPDELMMMNEYLNTEIKKGQEK